MREEVQGGEIHEIHVRASELEKKIRMDVSYRVSWSMEPGRAVDCGTDADHRIGYPWLDKIIGAEIVSR